MITRHDMASYMRDLLHSSEDMLKTLQAVDLSPEDKTFLVKNTIKKQKLITEIISLYLGNS